MSENFIPNELQIKTARESWDSLRPLQRRFLLEDSLSTSELDCNEIHDAIDYIIFRKFNEVSPRLRRSIVYMIGGK